MARKSERDLEKVERIICELRDSTREAIANASLPTKGDVMTLGELIYVERTQRKLSLQEVADAAGMTKSHIWEMEDGRSKNPTVKAIYGLSVALGVPFVAVCRCALKGIT
jgi:Helix-turn-helix domain